MNTAIRSGRVNIRLVVILVGILAVIGVAGFIAHRVRKQAIASDALTNGRAAIAAEDWALATKELLRYLSKFPDDESHNGAVLKEYAEAHMAVRPLDPTNVGAAIGAYRRIIRVYPDPEHVTPSLRELTRLYEYIGDMAELAYTARRWKQLDESSAAARLVLCQALVAQRKYDDALPELHELISMLEDDPQHPTEYVDACLLVAAIAAEADLDISRADTLVWINRALDYAPSSARALMTRARYWLAPVDGVEPSLIAARADLESASELESLEPAALVALCQLWTDLGEFERADAILARIRAVSPETVAASFIDPDVWAPTCFNVAARLARSRGDTAAALQLADSALAPTEPDAAKIVHARYRLMALPRATEVYTTAGDLEKGRLCLNEYLALTAGRDLTPATEDALAVLQARVARAEGDWRAVIELLRPVATRAPDNVDAWLLLSEAYASTNQHGRAIEALRTYLDARPTDRNMTYNLAESFFRQRLFAEAELNARRAEALGIADKIATQLGMWGAPPRLRITASLLDHDDPAVALTDAGVASSPEEGADLLRIVPPIDIDCRLLQLESRLELALQRNDVEAIAALRGELRDLRDQYPEQVDISLMLARLLTRDLRQQPDQTELVATIERNLQQAIATADDDLPARLALARFYSEPRSGESEQDAQARREKALATMNDACAAHPESTNAWLVLAQLEADMVDDDAAKLAAVRRVLQPRVEATQSATDKSRLEIELAAFEIGFGDTEAGILRLKQLADADPLELTARSLLLEIEAVRSAAVAALPEGYAQRLVDEIQAIEGDSGVLWRYHQVAVWMANEGWSEHSHDIESLLSYCMQVDGAWEAPVVLLGEYYERSNEEDRAIDLYRRALRKNPGAAVLADRLLVLLERLGRYPEAQEILEQIRLRAGAADAAEILDAVDAGRIDEAIEKLTFRVRGAPDDAGARIGLARLIYQSKRDAVTALRLLDEAASLDPVRVGSVAARVEILLAEGRSDEAEALIDEYIEQREAALADDDSAANISAVTNAHLLRASYLVGRSEFDAAEQVLTNLRERFASNGLTTETLGHFYFNRGRLDEAVSAFEQGHAAFPDNLTLQQKLVESLLIRGGADDKKRAAQMLDDLRAARGDHPDVLMVEAALAMDEGTAEGNAKAEQLYKRVLEQQPRRVAAHAWLASLALGARDYDRAAERVTAALAVAPTNVQVLLLSARTELALGRPRRAWQVAQRILRSDPTNAAAVRMILAVCEDTGDPEMRRNAAGGLQSIVEADTDRQNAAARAGLAGIYLLDGALDQAADLLSDAMSIDADSIDVLRVRIALLAARGELTELLELLDDYRTRAPDDIRLLVVAATSLATSPDADHRRQAGALCEEMLATRPGLPAARHLLARLAWMDGDAADAERQYREMLEEMPDYTPTLNDLAWVLAQGHSDDPNALEEALSLADRALVRDSRNRSYLDTRATILEMMPNRLQAARDDRTRCVELSTQTPPEHARALLMLAAVCVKQGDLESADRHLSAAEEIDAAANSFSPAERERVRELRAQINSPSDRP